MLGSGLCSWHWYLRPVPRESVAGIISKSVYASLNANGCGWWEADSKVLTIYRYLVVPVASTIPNSHKLMLSKGPGLDNYVSGFFSANVHELDTDGIIC